MWDVGEIMEKETVRMKMKEILESSFSVPSLKEAVLTSIEEHTKQSDFLFGRLAGVHYQMFSENIKETERIAAAVELMMLAGDLLDDLVDQDSLEISWRQVPLATFLHVVVGLLLAGQKAIADLPIDDKKSKPSHNFISIAIHMDVTCGIRTETDDLKNGQGKIRFSMNIIRRPKAKNYASKSHSTKTRYFDIR